MNYVHPNSWLLLVLYYWHLIGKIFLLNCQYNCWFTMINLWRLLHYCVGLDGYSLDGKCVIFGGCCNNRAIFDKSSLFNCSIAIVMILLTSLAINPNVHMLTYVKIVRLRIWTLWCFILYLMEYILGLIFGRLLGLRMCEAIFWSWRPHHEKERE